MSLTEEQARKQVRKEREFYSHLASYLIVNAFFVALNLLTDPGSIWFIFPMLGWGIGLASHASSVFGLPGIGRDWEARRLRALTGQDTEEATTARLRRLLDEELDERALPAASEPASVDRLQRRIEHLEAIVTSRDWDLLDAEGLPADAPAPRLALDEETARAHETAEERAARLARRVR
jgi:hypothetical protein